MNSASYYSSVVVVQVCDVGNDGFGQTNLIVTK